jgi:hypothetical protein
MFALLGFSLAVVQSFLGILLFLQVFMSTSYTFNCWQIGKVHDYI